MVHVILSRHSVVLTRAVSPALAGGAGANVLKVTNEYVKWIQFVTGKKKKKSGDGDGGLDRKTATLTTLLVVLKRFI